MRNVERRTARKLVRLAQDAEEAGLHATAREIRERVLVLRPRNALTRAKLGFVRAGDGWRRTPAERARLAAHKDADPKLARQYRRDAALVEEEHLRELVRVAAAYGTPAERRRLLLPYLKRLPRRADLHVALGHKKVGPDYVRPELLPVVGRLRVQTAAWRASARREIDVGVDADGLRLPGFDAPLTCRTVGARRVAGTFAPPDVEAVARSVGRTRAFLELTLGAGAAAWDPSPLAFLSAKGYTKLLATLHPHTTTFKLYHAYANYEHADFYAVRAFGVANAAERYAHGAAFRAMYELAAPDRDGGRRDARVYAWLYEGFGYFAALELCDAAYLSFASLTESAAKRAQTRPPPKQRTRANCLAWTREQVLAGHGRSLRALCGASLNNLDFLASMEAAHFVRFLLALSPAAFQRLPSALRAERAGAPADRADRVLRALYGAGLAELDPLRRAFLLEITP